MRKDTYKSCFGKNIEAMLKSRVERGYAPDSYIIESKYFDQFCAEKDIQNDDLTEQVFFGWLESELANNRKMTRQKLCFFNNLAYYYMANSRDAYLPHTSFAPTKMRQERLVLSEQETKALFAKIDTICEWSQISSFTAQKAFPVACRLCFSCGLRPAEACNLLRKDVDLLRGIVFVRNSKGGKDRIVVVGKDMENLLNQYDNELASAYPTTKYLFPQEDGSLCPVRKFSTWVNRCWHEANNDLPEKEIDNYNMYNFRHQFATMRLLEWSKKGSDYMYSMIPYLRVYMGHTIIDNTLYYVRFLPEMITSKPDNNLSDITTGDSL